MKKYLISLHIAATMLMASTSENNFNLLAQLTLQQQKEINALKEEIRVLKEIKIPQVAYEHKIVNVKEWANFRDKPWGKIIKKLPLGTKINVIDCKEPSNGGLTWCKSHDFGGGYISNKLVSWDKK